MKCRGIPFTLSSRITHHASRITFHALHIMENNLEMPLRQCLEIIQNRVMNETSYFGIRTLKNPIDFWIYQEIIFQTQPDFIIEIGNFFGGSTLALAHLLDNLGKGQVIALDISHQDIPDIVRNHPRIRLIEGDACESFEQVSGITGDSNVMVIEDSLHTFDNTLAVLKTYSCLVKPGNYFIVEDSICHHGLDVGPDPGPYEAIEAFLMENKAFEADRTRESFFITWNPKGYLRRM
ncbi:CmcI family methyltransferase [Desulfococcaceae bacterium HSG8]|nr:CmcI family methyltransferase [Desulfococcaceae bacterium HSG8]